MRGMGFIKAARRCSRTGCYLARGRRRRLMPMARDGQKCFEIGEAVVIRYITREGSLPGMSWPARVVEDGEECTALYIPAGTEFMSWGPRRHPGGPKGAAPAREVDTRRPAFDVSGSPARGLSLLGASEQPEVPLVLSQHGRTLSSHSDRVRYLRPRIGHRGSAGLHLGLEGRGRAGRLRSFRRVLSGVRELCPRRGLPTDRRHRTSSVSLREWLGGLGA